MIQRYTNPAMGKIWTDENRFARMLVVEIAACEAMARLGQIPKKAVGVIKRKAKFSVERVKEIEKETHHDVVAFLGNLAENIGPDSKYLHMGLTSSDVLDTALAYQMKQAAALLIRDLDHLSRALKRKAKKYKNAVMMGRSHGVHAEPVTFGLKMALFYQETLRNIERMKKAKDIISVGKISGAVGTYANVDPRVEEYACRKLGLKQAVPATQVIQRDRHAEFLTTIAVIGSSLDKIATEFRALQKTEVSEVEEHFGKKQTGSSAMPHKKNPVKCERISGLARLLRGNAQVALENVALWHERDISHSSCERIIIPDSTIILDYMLNEMTNIVDKLVVHVDAMKRNMSLSKGLVFSQRVLLAIIDKGATRQEAYKIVQSNAMYARNNNLQLKEVLLDDVKIKKYLNDKEIEKCFDLSYHLKYIDKIFKKAGI